MKTTLTALTLTAALAAPSLAQQERAEALAEVLAGSFTSLEQCSTPGWGCVESELVRIWPERDDGVWLYQENAWLGEDPDAVDPYAKARPYFQRLVRLVQQDETTVLRTIYSLNDPQSVVGAYETPQAIEAEQLGEPNCSGPVERLAHGWWVADFPTCPSNLRGAVRTHSRSIHGPDAFVNWDRGFTADGQVAWGPSEGGYIFKRKAE